MTQAHRRTQVTPSTFTGHCSQQPAVSASAYMYCSACCVHPWEVFSLTAVLRSSLGPLKVTNRGQGVCLEREAELPWKQPCQSQTCFAWFSCWTARSRPSASTCVTHTHKHKLLFANNRLVLALIAVTNSTILNFPIGVADSCSAVCP